MNKPIAILTDFGTSDPFVGIMKGVILKINPSATILDLTHDIPPGEIFRAAISLWAAVPYFPKETIFLAVVDPGVGTSRHAIYIKTPNYSFIGPDNGIFSFVIEPESQTWIINNPAHMLIQQGKTFHGRDIFAPAAAFASLGIQGKEFGPQMPSIARLPDPILEVRTPQEIEGEVLYGDHFGNILTSIGIFTRSPKGIFNFHPWIGVLNGFPINLDKGNLHLPNHDTLSWAETFAEIPNDECALIVGSNGLIEIASNRQRAVDMLKLKPGDRLVLEIPKYS